METAVKILVMLAITLLLTYPFISAKGKLRRAFLASSSRYYSPHNGKNVFFVFLAIAVYTALLTIFWVFDSIAGAIYSIPYVGPILQDLIDGINSQVDFIAIALKMVFVNLIVIYFYYALKFILRKTLINPIFGIGKSKKKRLKDIVKRKKRKKKGKGQVEEAKPEIDKEKLAAEEENEKIRKRRRIPDFVHSVTEDEGLPDPEHPDDEEQENPELREHGPVAKFILSIFFEGENYRYARAWVMRVRMVMQCFIRLVEVLYLVFLLTTLIDVFFGLPMWMYDLMINVLHLGDWYLYPAISILLLQEICHIFDTYEVDPKPQDVKKEEEQKEDAKRENRARALLSELKKRFDAEHALRYYPEVPANEIPVYNSTNVAYASAMKYIGKQMEAASGRVVQSYMECLDAIYNEMHVYFSASFYSELGEYLIAYTYIRLLSGSRMIFIVSDEKEKETLRTYINDRLMKMTGSSAVATWRVYTAAERLDQADVLIATPDDFVADNIVEQYPAFFEEACNAVFIDADKMVAINSYLCPVIATRLKKATNNRIRFVFLSLDLLKGFAAGNLPKLFCVDKVLSFSSAQENEMVSYVLWNKESKKRRIYNKSGQKNSCLETIIAEQAFHYGMDGVRVITEAPLEHAERQMLALHDVEINNLYKDVVDVNYMIYSDDRCNLSAALYACTRFRGRKKSVVHILSKPYLLREYFMSKTNTEDYINRSSFIQPRVTEHIEDHKLSLLRIFCDVTADGGLPVEEFEAKMRTVIATQKEKGSDVSSVFCRRLAAEKKPEEMKTSELAAYLVAGLCDNDPFEVAEGDANPYLVNSVGNRAKDFYLIIDPAEQNCYALVHEKKIVFNRAKEVLNYVLACNKRVELRLNDEVIGVLDTFPSRVHLEYIEGQSIIYKNAEYEIEHISKDGSTIYLRHENISIKNCLDTVLLRKYDVESITPTGKSGVLNHSTSNLEEIEVTRCKAQFTGTTYGFYSITPDRQTIDFHHGVVGNPHISNPHTRTFTSGNVLHVSLKSRIPCTDGMRRLLAAVFNEFIRTIFPRAYHCVSICPILMDPVITKDGDEYEDTVLNRIKTLYPFIHNPNESFVETDEKRLQFLFINDCSEDIGVLDWFFDPSGRYMQEFLANVYSYLHWLKLRPNKAHYIYFGGDSLPECYDLDGCCELLKELNLILSDDGKKDYETAGEDVLDDKVEYCSFCHKPMESGRFSFFDKHRFICADCFETVDDPEQLSDLYIAMREYLITTYPEIVFGTAKMKFDPVYDLQADQELSEYYSRVDFMDRSIYVEKDDPITNVRVSILRGLVALWQADNSLVNHYAPAQLYFEELCYLRSIGEDESADWIYHALPAEIRVMLDEMKAYVDGTALAEETDAEGTDEAEAAEQQTPKDEQPSGERRTSFSFMVLKNAEFKSDDNSGDDDLDDEEYSDSLYDPNKIPRFWKRYLRGQHIDDGNEEDTSEAEIPQDEEDEDITDNTSEDTADDTVDNTAEGTDDDVAEDAVDEASEETPEEIPEGEDEEGAQEQSFDPDDRLTPNAPPEMDGEWVTEGEETTNETDATDEEPALSDKQRKKQEKQRKKDEKKRLREEKKRQKQLEWEQSMDALDEEERKRRSQFGDEPKDEKSDKTEKKKRGLFKSKKDKKQQPEEDNNRNDVPVEDDQTLDVPPQDVEDTSDEPMDEQIPAVDEKDEKDKKRPKDKKGKGKDKKKDGKKKAKRRGKTRGDKFIPYEDDEATNPKIRVYNDLVRAAYNYSEEPISRQGVSDKELEMIFQYVSCDYPELFWLRGYSYTPDMVMHRFRCKDANGRLDIKQINKKRREMEKGAKTFTKGITKKTDPYKTVLTIYRRLILTLDYDMAGLNAHIDLDQTRDDSLRSLYNALVHHKVVCAGYAVAMQYLLQSVGIVCGFVVSDDDATGSCHAFNILKIGKYCYYLDATWGDWSSTEHQDYKDVVFYDYFCTPYK